MTVTVKAALNSREDTDRSGGAITFVYVRVVMADALPDVSHAMARRVLLAPVVIATVAGFAVDERTAVAVEAQVRTLTVSRA